MIAALSMAHKPAARCRALRHALAIAAAAILSTLASAPTIAGDPAYGQYLSGECVTCHRADGSERGIPGIVGWAPDHFVAVMNSYRDRQRENPVMQTIAGRLSQSEIQALAAYFGSLKPN